MSETAPLAGKTLFITGGSRGLGRSMALKLAQQGIGVIFTYAGNARAAEETLAEIAAQSGGAAALQLDQTDPAQIASLPDRLRTTLRETFGRDTIDHIVNNAGTGHWALFADTTGDQLDDLYAVHVKGPFLLTQALLPMIEDGGKIVMISDARGAARGGAGVWQQIEMPAVDGPFAAIVYAVPVQQLAYHTALERGTDVDQPRNLAKSVTVE